MLAIQVFLVITAYCLVGIFISGVYIGLDFEITRERSTLAIVSVALVLWPMSIMLGLFYLVLLAIFKVAYQIQSVGRMVGFELSELLEQ